MSPVELDLAGRWIAIAKPAVAVSTAGAYSGISLHDNTPSVAEITGRDISCWRKKLVNDFEESVFALHPEIGALRDAFYAAGALYAAMSGSGSAVFGIFDHRPARIGHGVFFHAEQFRIYK
jgi:4-diphosphocytidyl-2-C-methyl-D-erythritol kinase